MKRKVLTGLLVIAGVTTAIVKAVHSVRNRYMEPVDAEAGTLTIFELDERYPNKGCLVEQLKEYIADLFTLNVDTLDVVSVHCYDNDAVSVSFRDKRFDYDVEYYIEDSSYSCCKYRREFPHSEDAL